MLIKLLSDPAKLDVLLNSTTVAATFSNLLQVSEETSLVLCSKLVRQSNLDYVKSAYHLGRKRSESKTSVMKP